MTRPHLTTHRPSATTALYTVSTGKPLTTLSRKTVHLLSLLLRIISFILILLLLALKFAPADQTPSRLQTLHTSLQLTNWTYILPPALLALLTFTLRRHRSESLLTLRSLGIQTSTQSSSYLLPNSNTRFIPTSQIRDLFIHEAFLGFEVRYYLAVVVEGEEEVVVVFPKLLPGREVVEEVWRGARGCLYEAEEKENRRGVGDDGGGG